ncbi:MAG TPA: long-chain fatty acid--CoA ligase [Baekduia sp.]|uniref:long-chain-fatty-acid--CoA ligase n=1 Tax=Baekduia sp. TaxID=2600305 RepID=UPI002D76FEBF|nr:long-chain fatty acid--CoA ligase [Baekduia sp.]HET6507610.1 long-chain fatty acid--CoA ligase [Baekduia sp.]
MTAGAERAADGGVAEILTASAVVHADRPAVSLGADTLTYAQLDAAAGRTAARLAAAGVGRGDRVAVLLPNVMAFPVVYHAVLRLGAIVVPLNPLLRRREITYTLEDAGARAVVAWPTAVEEARAAAGEVGGVALVDVDDERPALAAAGADPALAAAVAAAAPAHDDTAVILYTSGTTGRPKGAELTHANLVSNARASARLFGLDRDDVVFGGLPLFHSFGQTCVLNAALLSGAHVRLVPRFSPDEALAMVADGVTVFAGVPTMYTALLAHAAPSPDADADAGASRLRLCLSGGASLPVEVLRDVEARFDCPLLEGYGLSETSPVAAFNRVDGRTPGSIGRPIDGVEMRVVDDARRPLPAGEVGEIEIRGDNVMKGYWRRPDATAETVRDGWLATGDMARVDDAGRFFIVDRKKDLIIRGGYNVYPREVEEVLYEHPAVREAAVVAVPDDHLGQEVGAAVVLRAPAAATPEELRAFVRERVAPYKYPRVVRVVDELPKGPTGKVLKREIAL